MDGVVPVAVKLVTGDREGVEVGVADLLAERVVVNRRLACGHRLLRAPARVPADRAAPTGPRKVYTVYRVLAREQARGEHPELGHGPRCQVERLMRANGRHSDVP